MSPLADKLWVDDRSCDNARSNDDEINRIFFLTPRQLTSAKFDDHTIICEVSNAEDACFGMRANYFVLRFGHLTHLSIGSPVAIADLQACLAKKPALLSIRGCRKPA